jgi:hypothetical protein
VREVAVRKKHVVRPNASKSHAHSPARAVERVGPLEGSRPGGGGTCRTIDAAVRGGVSAAMSGVAVHVVVSLDNAMRAGSMSIRMGVV